MTFIFELCLCVSSKWTLVCVRIREWLSRRIGRRATAAGCDSRTRTRNGHVNLSRTIVMSIYREK